MITATHCAGPDCGKPLPHNPRRITAFCKSCSARVNGARPERRAKASAAMKARMMDPAYRAAHLSRTTNGTRKRLATDPAFVEFRREQGRALGNRKLGMTHHGAGSALRAANGRKSSETKLAWCPIEYRAEYRRLIKSQNLKAAEARPIIEDMIAADARRYAATGILPQSARTEGARA